MKKIAGIILMNLMFLGCKSIVQSSDVVTSTGTLQKLEFTTWAYGSYSLNNGSGKPVYALESGNTTLDLSKYQNMKVKIVGTKVQGYPVDGGPPFVKVTNIELAK